MIQNERNKSCVARCLGDGKMAISEGVELLALGERQMATPGLWGDNIIVSTEVDSFLQWL